MPVRRFALILGCVLAAAAATVGAATLFAGAVPAVAQPWLLPAALVAALALRLAVRRG